MTQELNCFENISFGNANSKVQIRSDYFEIHGPILFKTHSLRYFHPAAFRHAKNAPEKCLVRKQALDFFQHWDEESNEEKTLEWRT